MSAVRTRKISIARQFQATNISPNLGCKFVKRAI
jgi:hypothetical protein